MWFGTMSGLNRYDGYMFKIFRHSIKDTASLNDDYIAKIEEGPEGKLWIQTREGANIYDPATEQFDRLTTAFLNKHSLPGYNLGSIIKSGKDFWFVYPDSGIYRYAATGKPFVLKHDKNNSTSIDANRITDVKADSKNNLWIIHQNGMLEKVDALQNKVTLRTNAFAKETTNDSLLYNMYIDAQDELWLYATGTLPGVYYYQPATNTLKHFAKDTKEGRLSNDIVKGIVQDDNGLIWIGTDHGGANLLDKKNYETEILINKPDDDKTLAQNSINSIYKDNLGIVWLGTYKKGVSYYRKSLIKFPLYRHQPSNTASLGYDDINVFAEDAIGNIWIGTNGGGLNYFDRKTNTFKKVTHDPGNTNSLSNDVIVSLYIDHDQNLWIGTYYGGLDRYDGKTFIHYRHSDTNPASIADDKVWEIYEDVDKHLWIGTLDGGLDMLDREHNIFYHHKSGEPNSVYSNYIPAFAEDTQNNLWIGTSYGIDVLEKKTGKFIHYSNADNKLSNNNIIDLLKDSNGSMWVGTRDGLNVFDTLKKTFQSFRTEDGLPDNNILNILEDNKQNIWVSTANGISRITVQGNQHTGFNIKCKNYDESDGLQGKEFNENASLKTRSGELVFGGASGFNIFDPENISTNKNIPPLAFTDFQLFNRSVNVGEKVNGHIILPGAISQTSTITLNYDENIFSIEFAALSFANTEKNKYAYILENFNKEWSTTDGRTRKATYTNLDPGEYTFIVKASNDDDVWNEKGISLKITILPPFWKTPLAYLLYFLLVGAILYFARFMIIQRAQMRFALEQERKEANRMHELDMMKIRFFTNVSHEFRTPLSLILTPLDKIIRTTSEPDKKNQFQLIHRNARRLLNLVNQLLDFRKMEVQELKLHPSNGDIAKFIKEISYTFTDLAGNKNIEFAYHSSVDELYTKFDHDKIERILFNLLSNAFKFTSENGKVSVELNSYKKAGETLIEIKITDNGIGIPPEKQEKIFERFFQSDIPGTMVNQGSGIGLAITKEFVKLHDGFISVESQVDNGSCFTVLLPFTETAATTAENHADEIQMDSEGADDNFSGDSGTVTLQPATVNGDTLKNKKPVVLIVEDNEDFRFYLKDNLREFFTITEAVNGKDGWQKVLSHHPDLVVSDISMPVMNGIDLCKKIKQDARTAQIPVILLTALMSEDQQVKGLETGASDYITKPFSFEIMLSRIKNILAGQASLKKVFTKQVEVKTTEVAVESPSEKLIQQALEIVEKNLSNTAFSVEELSRELYMSRVSVYKKIFTLTGKTPIEFIRSIRLKHAAQLLEKSSLTIAEIAYESGFNNPKYFTKYFKAEFNIVPSEYAAQKKKEAEKT